MGIQTEYNPDLALRNIEHYLNGKREKEECPSLELEVGKIYDFLKKGQRLYWLLGEIPLLETEGEGKLSKPLTSIVILEATHFLKNNEIYTKGKYLIKEINNPNKQRIMFNGFAKI